MPGRSSSREATTGWAQTAPMAVVAVVGLVAAASVIPMSPWVLAAVAITLGAGLVGLRAQVRAGQMMGAESMHPQATAGERPSMRHRLRPATQVSTPGRTGASRPMTDRSRPHRPSTRRTAR